MDRPVFANRTAPVRYAGMIDVAGPAEAARRMASSVLRAANAKFVHRIARVRSAEMMAVAAAVVNVSVVNASKKES